MNRREFFKLAGIGAGGILLTTSLLGAAFRVDENAFECADFAVAYALKRGATYADAHIGACEIQGHGQNFEALHLLNSELLGMRICIHDQWRHIVIRDLEQAGIAHNLDLAMKNAPALQSEKAHWISATFDSVQRLAYKSSDPEIAADLQTAWLRYRQRPALPQHDRNLLFCDMLIVH